MLAILTLPLLFLTQDGAQDPARKYAGWDPLTPIGQPAPERRQLPLRIEDVARFVQERAPGIRQAILSSLANSGSVLEAEGAFDPVLFAEATASYDQNPTAGGFLNAGVSSTHTRVLNANQGIRTLLMTGATVTLRADERYGETNLPSTFFGLNPASNVSIDLLVTQPILRGAWDTAVTQGVRSAEIAYDRGLATLQVTTLANLGSAIDAFWDLYFALEDVQVKEFSLQLAVELKQLTQARYRVGAAAEVDVVQTERDIAARTDQLITAHNTVRLAEDNLRLLIFSLEEAGEWDFDLRPTSEPPEAVPTGIAWHEALEVALQHRPELRQLRLDVEQAQLNWDVAQQNLLPRLELVARGTTRGLADQINDAWSPGVLGLRQHGYSIGFVFEVPLGNNQFSGVEHRSRMLYHLAQRTLRDQEHSISVEVRDAVRSVNFLSERVKTTRKASEVAARTLEAEQRRLREGASTNFEVLQFQRDLSEALSLEKGARAAYAKAVTRLWLVQGLQWDGSQPARVHETPLEEAESRVEAYPDPDEAYPVEE